MNKDTPMDDELRAQIYNRMNQKETDELIAIWQTHDSEEWTETAFDVVKDILLNRLGELPPQDEVLEETGQDEEELAPAEDDDVLLETEESEDSELEELACPNCKGNDLLIRQVGLSGDGRNIVLKGPTEHFDDVFKDDEIVGIACQSCGHVFFMLKDFIDL
jgi:hypothetical protein